MVRQSPSSRDDCELCALESGHMGDSVEYVVESYADYLRGNGQRFWRRFQATRTESAGISTGRGHVLPRSASLQGRSIVADAPGTRGPEFLCLQTKPQEFMVEVTSLLPERVTEKSNIPNRTPQHMKGRSFGLLTAQIDQTATKKVPQFKGITKPGILAIASSHFGSTILMDALAAMNALISQPFWVGAGDDMFTDLKYSLFLRREDGHIVIKNRDISAVLLVAVELTEATSVERSTPIQRIASTRRRYGRSRSHF